MPYTDDSTPARYLAERGPGFFVYGEAEMARSRDEITYLPNTVAVAGAGHGPRDRCRSDPGHGGRL